MAVYKLQIKEILTRDVLVEADSMSEAEETVKNAADNGTIQFRDDDDFENYEVAFSKVYPDGISEKMKKDYSGYADDYITADGERLEGGSDD